MNRRTVPAAATWFLKLFCSSTEYESVTGDLLEHYQLGRGRFWYWRQVGVAIAAGASRDLWHHLPVALAAIVTGLFVAATPVWVLQNTSAAWLSNYVPLPVSVQILAAWLVVFGSALVSGWLVSLLFRAHRAVAVLSLAVANVVAGGIILHATDLGLLALGSVTLLDGLAVVAGGSLTRFNVFRPS